MASLRRSNRLQVQDRTCDFHKAGKNANCFRIAIDNFIKDQVFKFVCFQFFFFFFTESQFLDAQTFQYHYCMNEKGAQTAIATVDI